jgi:apolipoprotein N-acyltransferase
MDPGWLSFICLVPWLIFLSSPTRGWPANLMAYGVGTTFYLVNTSYLYPLAVEGYVALGLFFGLYYWAFAWVVRTIHRRWQIPMTWIVPIVWVATEYVRSIGPLALPLLFLAHGTYRLLPLIQIADVLGAAGVSFVVAMVNGCLADVICWRVNRGPSTSARSIFAPMGTTVLVLAVTLLYGVVRLGGTSMSEGPRIAVVQGDYPLSIGVEHFTPSIEKEDVYFQLMADSIAEKPDLVLLPETPWSMLLNEGFLKADRVREKYRPTQLASRQSNDRLEAFAQRHNVSVVIGAGSMDTLPDVLPPNYRKYNSAFVFSPQGAKQRYDKVALVMFGEYTPFRFGPFHSSLYVWLDSFNPFSSREDEFSLTPGAGFSTFEFDNGKFEPLRFGIPICFEDLIPGAARDFTIGPDRQKEAHFLLSISNDGWFNHGAVVAQHLAVCAFRAVENRIAIARSVNTACSGFIDPDGTIHDLVNDGGRVLGRGIFGYTVAPMKLDSRTTLYSRFGEWFGGMTTIVTIVGFVVARRLRKLDPGDGPTTD